MSEALNADKGGQCQCGRSDRPHINHRKRIPCWAYIGDERCDICPICGLAAGVHITSAHITSSGAGEQRG